MERAAICHSLTDSSPELLLSVNYLAHAIFRRDVICAAAQASPDFEDAVYQCAENSACTVHVPEISIIAERRPATPAPVTPLK